MNLTTGRRLDNKEGVGGSNVYLTGHLKNMAESRDLSVRVKGCWFLT